MIRPSILAALVLALGAPAAADAIAPPPTPQALAAVFACGGEPDARRLACFDREVARLRAAVHDRTVAVVDRDQARAARREAFGFRLPSLSMLSGLAGGEEPASAGFVLAKAGRGADDRWSFETTDGQVWRTAEPAGFMRIRDGASAEVRRGALGAFFMKIDSGRAFKVERVR